MYLCVLTVMSILLLLFLGVCLTESALQTGTNTFISPKNFKLGKTESCVSLENKNLSSVVVIKMCSEFTDWWWLMVQIKAHCSALQSCLYRVKLSVLWLVSALFLCLYLDLILFIYHQEDLVKSFKRPTAQNKTPPPPRKHLVPFSRTPSGKTRTQTQDCRDTCFCTYPHSPGFVMQHLIRLNGKLWVSQTCAQTVNQTLESVAK